MPGLLSRLRLRHFRNFTALDVKFPSGIVVLAGPNGQGKTNLLEAIHYVSLLRSFRSRRLTDLCQWGASAFFIDARLEHKVDPLAAERLSVTFAGRRRLRIDGAELSRASEFINHLLCIVFAPEDIVLVKGPPSERRRFLDICLCQVSENYMSSLVQYQAALKSRNAMLKDPARFNRGSRMAYERQLARHGAVVTINRQRFVQAYEPLVRKVAQGLFPTGSSIGVQYKSQLLRRYDYDDEKMLEETMYEQLQAEADADTEWPTTRVGPHRDDLVLVLNEKPAAVFGSEGQCRLLSLALRLGFVNLLKRHQQDRDLVLLVDDVFGELDAERRHHFFRQLDVGAQIFVACTEVPPELKDKDVSIFDVARGSLRLRGE